MAVHYRTLGFIFKREDRGEADQFFTIFTKDFGKLEILGKSIRKIKSKLRSGADLFYFSEIEFIQGKTHRTLTDAILIEKFPGIIKNLEKLRIVAQIADVIDNLVSGEEKDENIWNLLIEMLQKLDKGFKFQVLGFMIYYFLWNLLALLGYKINLYNCAVCQKKLFPKKLYFNLKEGGIIDSDCFERIREGENISPETVKILRLLLENNWNTLLKLKIGEEYEKELEAVSENYLSHYKKSR